MAILDGILKSREVTLPTKVHLVRALVFPVVTYGCEGWTESWALKNWCFWTVVLEKTLESPLDCKEIQLVNPNRNQSWIFIGRTGTETEAPIYGHLMERTDSLEKTLMLGKMEGGREGESEDEMVGWHHQLDGHEFEQALGDGERQGSLACCSPQGQKELDTTEWLNNNNRLSCSEACGSSQTRHWTCVPYIDRWIPNHWTSREVLSLIFKRASWKVVRQECLVSAILMYPALSAQCLSGPPQQESMAITS